jgi:hypothetical protein
LSNVRFVERKRPPPSSTGSTGQHRVGVTLPAIQGITEIHELPTSYTSKKFIKESAPEAGSVIDSSFVVRGLVSKLIDTNLNTSESVCIDDSLCLKLLV